MIGIRDVRLPQRSHPARERLVFLQFLERHTPCVRVVRALGPELLVAVVEMLRQLVDDLPFAGRSEPERCQARAQIPTPLRHGQPR